MIALLYRLLIGCMLIALATAHAEDAGTGMKLIALDDPVSRQPMKAALFYPSQETPGTTRVGILEIAAKRDAAMRPGRYPLVVVSHGNGGSLFSHHDSATFLARHGYVVAAIEHPGDNFRDESGQGSDRVLAGRTMQLSALIDAVSQVHFPENVDMARIAVAGFSAGGYSALALAGARPRFDLLPAYCNRYPKSVLCVGGGTVRLSSPPLTAAPDRRVRAVFVMSPMASFFDPTALRAVSVPVRIYAAAADSVLPPEAHARLVRDNIANLTGYTEIPGAGHFVFLAPCSAAMNSATPHLCNDPPGVDRRLIHDELNREMLRFLDSQLRP